MSAFVKESIFQVHEERNDVRSFLDPICGLTETMLAAQTDTYCLSQITVVNCLLVFNSEGLTIQTVAN